MEETSTFYINELHYNSTKYNHLEKTYASLKLIILVYKRLALNSLSIFFGLMKMYIKKMQGHLTGELAFVIYCRHPTTPFVS